MTYRDLRQGSKEIVSCIAQGAYISPSDHCLHAAAFFESSCEKSGFLNYMVAIATGHRLPSGWIYQLFEIL